MTYLQLALVQACTRVNLTLLKFRKSIILNVFEYNIDQVNSNSNRKNNYSYIIY